MLKHCAFGRQKAQAIKNPPGWSQCTSDFSEWDPETPSGLTLQLKAFQQVFYAFQASGAPPSAPGPLASDGILRLIPASLRAKSSFHIRYEAVYVTTNGASRTPPRELKGTAVVSIAADAAEVVDSGKNYEEQNAVKMHKADGRDVLDVRFRLRNPLRDDQRSFMELESLTCFVQLHIPGAAAEESADSVLVVPSTHQGRALLKVVVHNKRSAILEAATSLLARS